MNVNPVSRAVEDFLEGNTNFENYALVCQPESAKESSANALLVCWNQERTDPSPAISDSVIQRIKDALESIRFKDPYVLVQFWARYQTARNESGCLLKTLNQPFGITDLSLELLSYRMASLKEKYHVNLKSKQANGLVGNVFLKGSPDWTPNIGGHLAIPVFEDGHFCLGVLEIVTTIEKERYDWEFIESCRALQGVNLRSSQVLSCSMNKVRQGSKPNVKANVGEGVRQRRNPITKTSKITYEDISSRFGMPRAAAAKELNISPSSLRTLCRKFNKAEWPYKKESRGLGTPSLSSTGEEDGGGKSPMEASDHPH